jgi:hypothetical protein
METSPVPTSASAAWAEQMAASLHAERDGVREFLDAQQRRLELAEATLEGLIAQFEELVAAAAAENAEHHSPAGDGDGELDYQRRYEMALEDLRELKETNAQLQDQLAKARAASASSSPRGQVQSTALDWETQKRRMLAALESELDENDSEQRAERLKIEDVLRATEQVIAQKDEQIRELKRQLEESGSVNNLLQAASAVEQVIQSDSAIQEERERLRQLEEKLQGQLRQAEIEISLERAKLARERAEMDEKLRRTGAEAPKPADGESAPAAPEQPTRGRWMSRLGLTDADRERGKRR